MFGFGLSIVVTVLIASAAPTAGIHRVYEHSSINKLKGIDRALVIDTALPKIVQAVLTLQNRYRLINVHNSTFLTSEIALAGLAFKLIDEHFDFIRPFDGFL